MRVLIVEDELKTYEFLKKGFTECLVVADVATDGEEGLHRALASDYDIVILDVMLPKLDGWSVLHEMRRKRNETPVIMLTARDAIPDRIKGFELGADDYLIKPFAFSELLLRISAILRRGTQLKDDVLRIADLEIDLERRKATRAGKRLDLTPKEFMLLSLLGRHSGDVVTRARIAERVWNVMETDADTNLIDVHIRRLRSKVDDPFEKKLIHTVRRSGYVLEDR